MNDQIVSALLSSKSISNMVNDLDSDHSEKWQKKARQAVRKHAQGKYDPEDPIEKQRNNCIEKVCELQHEIIMLVSDEDFKKKVLALILEHTSNIYVANSVQELSLLNVGLSRIENSINSYKKERKWQKFIRLTAVTVSFLCLASLGFFLWYNSQFLHFNAETTITILNIPIPVLLWSMIGSFSAILYRFTNTGDKELSDPLRWLFARTLTGIVMGLISYLILKVGLLTIQEGKPTNTNSEVIGLIAFIAGFSDSFSESLLKNVVGKFGGDKHKELITIEAQTNKTGSTASATIVTNSKHDVEVTDGSKQQEVTNTNHQPTNENETNISLENDQNSATSLEEADTEEKKDIPVSNIDKQINMN